MKIDLFDPRSICNLMLEEADRFEFNLSNLALQKLLYFAHSLYLIEHHVPLVSGYFEAWKYGPVHPTAYNAFKAAGEAPIKFRAEKKDPLTGVGSPISAPNVPQVNITVASVLMRYGKMTPGRLVEISHAKGAPWQFVVDNATNNMAIGLRISDSIISERFKFHKVSVGLAPLRGEPSEDAPFA